MLPVVIFACSPMRALPTPDVPASAPAAPSDPVETSDPSVSPEATPTATVDTGTAPGTTADTATPVAGDCGAIDAAPDWEVCVDTPGVCEAVFDDGVGCIVTCAAAGLGCQASWDDDGACGADTTRPALACEWTGHASDYCECGGAVVVPVEDCATYPYRPDTLWLEREGFGATATGGDPDNVYRVTTLSSSGAGSVREALESADDYWIVFDVEGTIAFSDRIDVRSNKTLDGRGRDVVLNGELRMLDVRNVIVTDLVLTNDSTDRCGQDGDVISVRGSGGTTADTYTSRDLWFHHLELYDGGDGLIDLRGASNVTMSWNHFHDHEKVILASRTMDELPATGMDVTFHHNWFDHVTRRGPQFGYGRAHLYNNYNQGFYEFGVASLDGAQLLSEANIYEARAGTFCVVPCPDPNPCGDDDFVVSKEALITSLSANDVGYALSYGDLALNGAVIDTNQTALVFPGGVPYAYTAEVATTALAADIAARVGPRDPCP